MKRYLPFIAVLFALLLFSGGTADADAPDTVGYQGRVSVNGKSYTGDGLFKFAIVNTAGTAAFWSHDGTGLVTAPFTPTGYVTLTVDSGLFNVSLGDTAITGMTEPITASVFITADRALRVWFSDQVHGWQMLAPDVVMSSVPFAFQGAGSVAYGAGTLSVSSANDATIENHTHAVTASSNPGVAAALLATDSNGRLVLTGSSSYSIQIVAGAATVTPAVVKGTNSQSVDLQQWQNNSGAVMAGVTSGGRIFSYGDTASSNVVFGDNNTGKTGTTYSVLIGTSAGKNVTGAENFFLGAGCGAGAVGSTAARNVGVGKDVFSVVTSADSNTGIGKGVLGSLTSGGWNCNIGRNSGSYLTTASENTMVGSASGAFATGSGNVFLGYRAGRDETGSNKLYVANSATTTPLIYGTFSGTGAGITIHSQATDGTPLTVRGIASQSSGLQEWKNHAGTVLVSVGATGDMLLASTGHVNWRDSAIGINSQADGYMNVYADSAVRIGDSTPTNYTQVDADGDISFVGTARIDWAKVAANSITLSAGSGTGTVSNLQTAHDGSFYKIDEAAATPGIDLVIDFVSVGSFNWVNVLAWYGPYSSTHAIAVQLYNWSSSAWDTFDAIQPGAGDVATAGGYVLGNYDCFVPSDANYIGTGGNAGQVRARLYHTMAGDVAHDLYIDVVALYK